MFHTPAGRSHLRWAPVNIIELDNTQTDFYIDLNKMSSDTDAGHNLPDKSCVADTAMQIELA